MAAQRKMTNSLLSLVALLAAASAVPMLPGIGGLGGLGGFGGLGMLGYGGLPGYGAKYNGGQSTGGTAPLLPATQPVLNGVTRNIVKGGLVSGISATITPVMSNNMQNGQGMMGGMHGLGGLYGGLGGYGGLGVGLGGGLGGYGGLGGGLGGGYGGLGGGLGGYGGGHGGMGGNVQNQKLEANIEFIDPVGGSLVLVFTESAPQSELSPCPAGPVLTGPPIQNQQGQGMGAGGYGYGGSMGMLGGHGMNMGIGMSMGMGMHIGMGGNQPDFGIISEINAQPGPNTFQITGLGKFNDLNQLAGRGVALCTDVEIAFDGRPRCVEPVVMCAKLGFTETPERLTVVVAPP